MQSGTACLILDNEPFVNTLDPAPPRTPVSLTRSVCQQPQPMYCGGLGSGVSVPPEIRQGENRAYGPLYLGMQHGPKPG